MPGLPASESSQSQSSRQRSAGSDATTHAPLLAFGLWQDTAYWHMYLCKPPSDEQVTEYILWQYETLWAKYEAARKELPGGVLTEVAFR
jgi:hypothetical protein